MNWLNVILGVVSCGVGFFGIYWMVCSYEKRIKESINLAMQANAMNYELLNSVELWTTVSLILSMKLCAANNCNDDFVKVYHKLYFMGVDKDILNNPNKLNDFLADCVNNRIVVKDGKVPFTHSYVRKG